MCEILPSEGHEAVLAILLQISSRVSACCGSLGDQLATHHAMLAKLSPQKRAYLTDIFKEMIEKFPG